MKHFLLLSSIFLTGCSITAQDADVPVLDLQSGDVVKAVIIDPQTGDVLEESEGLRLR